MSSRGELMQWVSNTQRDYGAYIPKDFPMNAFKSEMSDESLYNTAMSLYTLVKAAGYNQKQAAPSEHHDSRTFYLVPHKESDGSVYYADRKTGEIVMSITKQANGLFSYYGPKEMMEIFGGRGLMSQINQNMEDGDFFHNPEKKK